MDKYKIIALFGEAGSGKDYIQKKIMETDFGKKNLSEIISYTTRPPRQGEIDGVHYHFIPTLEEFFNYENLSKWIESTSFNHWWYGTSIDSLTKNKINIGVFNIRGIKQILEDEEVDCIPVYIKTINKIRLKRQLDREDDPNCDEIVRRYLVDKKDFLNIPFHHYVIENNYDEISKVVKEVLDIIPKEWYDKVKTD